MNCISDLWIWLLILAAIPGAAVIFMLIVFSWDYAWVVFDQWRRRR